MFTEVAEEEFLRAIEAGHTIADACESIGATVSWHYGKMKNDPEWEGRFNRARFKPVNLALQAITNSFNDDWKAAESFLKRARRKEWGDHQVTEHTGEPQIFKVEIVDNGRDTK